MKTKFNYLSVIALMAMAFGFLLVSCEKDDQLSGEPPLGGGTYIANLGQEQPVLIEGNPFCDDVGEFDLSSGKINWDKDEEKWEIIKDEEYSDIFPFDGVTVTVTDDKYVSFVVDYPLEIDGTCYALAAVIVKGGPSANVYYYDYRDGVTNDEGLHSPEVPGGIADLSNLSFCFIEVPCDDVCYEWICETAWADNECSKDAEPGSLRYVQRGNWATYVQYDGEFKDVSLYAGQDIEVGWVLFYPQGDEVKIVIGLFTEEVGGYPNAVIGWEFCPVEENVKIDGFNSLDDAKVNRQGNPIPGQFPYKYDATGTEITVTVPKFEYYGIHVEAGYWKEIECPEE